MRRMDGDVVVRARTLPALALGVLGLGVVAAEAGAQSRGHGRPDAKAHATAAVARDGSRDAPAPTPDPEAARSAPGIAAAVVEALAEYRSSGVARAVTSGTVTALPFGHVEPVVTCSVLRACVIELEPGEQLTDAPIAGDPVRWSVDDSKTGPGGETPLVLVKPLACDVTTNLIVPTDRRVYDLTLDSPACARGSLNPQRAGVRHVRFYYPDDIGGADRASGARLVSASGSAGTGPVDALAIIEEQAAREGRGVNRAYCIVRKRRGPFGLFGRKPVDFPWQPAGVVDDGARTYVALPVIAASHAAPVLYAIDEDGSRTMVNYAVRTVAGTSVYVADRVMRRAALVLMTGSRERMLEIENRGWGKPIVPADSMGSRDAGRDDADDGGRLDD